MKLRTQVVPPPGHRFYTSAATLASWGAGGPRGPSFQDYSSRGRKVTWPDVPGDWSTCRLVNPSVASHWEKPDVPSYWAEERLCRFPEAITTARRWTWAALGSDIPQTAQARTYVYTKAERTILANDGPTAEWLAERDAAGFATDYGQAGTRIERCLIEDESPLVATLRKVAELMRPPILAANDNSPSSDEGDADSGTGLERVHNQGCISPSVPVLLRAYEAGMQTGSRTIKDGLHRIGRADNEHKLTGLTFYNGTLTAYGDDKGRKRRPAYNSKIAERGTEPKSETARHVAAQDEQNNAYTKLKAAGVYVSAQTPNAPGSLSPPPRTARAVANDNVLAKAIANTKNMPTVNRLPDGVAAVYGRIAGVADSCGVGEGKTSAPMHEALTEMDRLDALAASGISRADLHVIDDILSDASFRSIGIERNYAPSSAHKMGRKVVEDVLKRISKKIAA